MVLSQHSTSIGIVSEDYPVWCWQIGMLGVVRWMISDKDLPGRMETDPPWRQQFPKLPDIKPVEVLLVHGAWPTTTEPIWKLKSLRVAVRITECKRTRRKRRKLVTPTPEGWYEVRRYAEFHDNVGGVTNGRF